MKVSRARKAANRQRILEAAARLFRERGIEGVGLDAVMQAAGLTHGALYSHFADKDDLVAQACAHALQGGDDSWRTAPTPAAALARLYLSEAHCANRGGGCALAALGADAGRLGSPVRGALAAGLEERVARLAASLRGAPRARRRRALAAWSTLVGALVLARAVDDPALSREILAAGRRALRGRRRPTSATASRTSGGRRARR